MLAPLVFWSLLAAEAPAGVRPETLDALNGALLATDPRPRIEALARLHSLRATAAFDEAAAAVAGWAREAGLTVTVEDFPADGTTRYGPFLSEPGWSVRSTVLRMVEPAENPLADFSKEPLSLAWFSGPAETTAELVDVGAGVSESDYSGKDVRGKIVLADGPHAIVHREAVYSRGAVGVASDWHLFPDRYPDVRSSDGAGIRPWVGPGGEDPGFVFSIPARAAAELRGHLDSGSRVVLHASVKTATHPSHYRVVSAVLPGATRPDEEVLLVNHLDSTAPGVVHNAAAAMSLLEVGSAIRSLVGRGVLAPPDRTLRFLWVPEHAGTMAYLLAHPELSERVVAAVNVDMPTARHGATGAVSHLYRTPDSTPSFADDLFGALLEWVRDANTPGLGTDVFPYPVIAEAGSREAFHAAVSDFEGLSDHVEFLASGIPMSFFGTWPFELLGTTRDTMDVFDATQMKRVSLVLAAGAYTVASVSPERAIDIAHTFLARAEERLLEETSRWIAELGRLSSSTDPYEAYQRGRNALTWKLDRELRALSTLSRLGVSGLERELRAAGERASERLERFYRELCERRGLPAREPALAEEERGDQGRVPEKTGSFRGPIDVDFLRESSHRELTKEDLSLFRVHPYAAFEAWNFVNGSRSVTEIHKAVSAELGTVAVQDVVRFFDVLADAGWIRYRGDGSNDGKDPR